MVAALLGLLVGCTSDWDPGKAGRFGAAGDDGVPQSADGIARIASASRAAALAGSSPFASLPDRGALMAYDRGAKPRIGGAYRAYSVRLSEEHALKAARDGGQIKLVAPNGEPIDLAYERHIEHPDGNWTWIGRDASGADAVITFGAKAVFGSIPFDGQESLRLTMAGGRSWLVETDSDKVVDADHAAMRASGKPDFFIPPKMAIGAAADKATAAASQEPVSAAAAAAAQTTVDVLLGYTNGFASAYGGQSQAVTRLNNLVDIANQAYTNSAVDARLRLVGTVAVNYTDATDNGDALEKLSGFNNSGPITPDPAFAGLRTARNTLGADLVALVRDFRTPENAGCGIAWLIGGGQTPIVQGDAPYGYSVVSDGSDVDEGDGNTYFCRDESLAHEFGHNMGQAHNAEDSSSAGTHAYSYGYREASTSGFYTVMAYRLAGSSQFAIRHFANPAVQYDGRATGVANTADNARSMNQSMPIVATFRASVVGPGLPDDINGDGKSDLFWHNYTQQSLRVWKMNGTGISYGPVNTVTAFVAKGLGDFNADGVADMIWATAGGTELWRWQGKSDATFTAAKLRSYPTGWELAGVGDAHGDGADDLFWHNPTTGQLRVWKLSSGLSYGPVNNVGALTAYATGDLDGDGKTDLVWIDNAKTQVLLWRSKGDGTFTQVLIRSFPGSGWSLIGAGDANGDGKTDLFWHNPGLNRLQVWRMNSAQVTYGPQITIGDYTTDAVGDYNGDGLADVILHDNARTQLLMWQGQANGTYVSSVLRSYPTGWGLLNSRPYR